MQTRTEGGHGTGDGAAAPLRRFRRYGQLPVPAGANGRELRCACDRCGAHLYATPGANGRPIGVCMICGFDSITPV